MDYESVLLNAVREIGFIEHLYDCIRVVDVARHKVLYSLKSNSSLISDSSPFCYSSFGKDTVCKNCISMRAFIQQKSFIKLEYVAGKVIMITAVPIQLEDHTAIVELIKDITSVGTIDIDENENIEIHKLINKRNLSLITDPLTKTYNEAFSFEKLYSDIMSYQPGKNVTIFLLRITNLESINDTNGYEAGDAVLKLFAKSLQYYIKNNKDWVARISGARFIMRLEDLDEKQVDQLYKRISDKLRKTNFMFNNKKIDVEISLGNYTLQDKNTTPKLVIEKADKKLYSVHKPTVSESFEKTILTLLDKAFLTGRERETAFFLLSGLSNQEIADKLFVSISTVKKHIASIFGKTDVKTRAEFLAKFKTQTKGE